MSTEDHLGTDDRLAVRIQDLTPYDHRSGLRRFIGTLSRPASFLRALAAARPGGSSAGWSVAARPIDTPAAATRTIERGRAGPRERQRSGHAARQRGHRGGDHALDGRAGQAQRAGGPDRDLCQPGRHRLGRQPSADRRPG